MELHKLTVEPHLEDDIRQILIVDLRLQDGRVVLRGVGALDAPLLGVEIVGTGADVLGQAEGNALEADLDEAARSVGRQGEGFVAQIGEGLRVGEGERKTLPRPLPVREGSH